MSRLSRCGTKAASTAPAEVCDPGVKLEGRSAASCSGVRWRGQGGGRLCTAASREPRPERRSTRFVGGDVRAQLKGSVHQPTRCGPGNGDVAQVLDRLLAALGGDSASKPAPPEDSDRLNIHEIRGGEFSMRAKQVPGLPPGLAVIADGVGQHPGVNDDHPRRRPWSRSAAATGRPTRPPWRVSIRRRTSSRVGELASRVSSATRYCRNDCPRSAARRSGSR